MVTCVKPYTHRLHPSTQETDRPTDRPTDRQTDGTDDVTSADDESDLIVR